jgi:hypothetical protein
MSFILPLCVPIPHVSSYLICVLILPPFLSSCYPHTTICTGRRSSSSSSMKQHYKTARAGSTMARLRERLRESLRSKGWEHRPAHLISESRSGGDSWRAGARGCSDALTLLRVLSLSGSLSLTHTPAGVAVAGEGKKRTKK